MSNDISGPNFSKARSTVFHLDVGTKPSNRKASIDLVHLKPSATRSRNLRELEKMIIVSSGYRSRSHW